jgi:arsenite methyltransferase
VSPLCSAWPTAAGFLRAGADDLSQIDDGSAFREFHRVLRPGGRASVFEPINRLNRFLRAYDAGDLQDLDDRIKGAFESAQPRDIDPMLNFDDRDLVELIERARFERVALTLEMKVEPLEPTPWDVYLDMAWNPTIPTMREVISQLLTPEEQDRYEAQMRPSVAAGVGSRRMVTSYLLAVKEPRDGRND